MRGAPDLGTIKGRNEVEPHNEGYRGVVVIPGQGRWETPEASTKVAAQILLDALNKKLLPKPKNEGISDAQAKAWAEALAA